MTMINVNVFHSTIVNRKPPQSNYPHGQSGYRTPMTLDDMTDDYYHLLTGINLSKVI
jgi:hypothetical protein